MLCSTYRWKQTFVARKLRVNHSNGYITERSQVAQTCKNLLEMIQHIFWIAVYFIFLVLPFSHFYSLRFHNNRGKEENSLLLLWIMSLENVKDLGQWKKPTVKEGNDLWKRNKTTQSFLKSLLRNVAIMNFFLNDEWIKFQNPLC